MKTTLEMLQILEDSGYPLTLIAKQAGVSYMKLFRFFTGVGHLTDAEHDKVKKFCIVQPLLSE